MKHTSKKVNKQRCLQGKKEEKRKLIKKQKKDLANKHQTKREKQERVLAMIS